MDYRLLLSLGALKGHMAVSSVPAPYSSGYLWTPFKLMVTDGRRTYIAVW